MVRALWPVSRQEVKRKLLFFLGVHNLASDGQGVIIIVCWRTRQLS